MPSRNSGCCEHVLLVACTGLVGGNFYLDPAPYLASQGHPYIEAAGFDDPCRGGDDLWLGAGQGQRPPGQPQRLVECLKERVQVAADQAVDVLGGTGGPRHAVLQVRAALEQEQGPAGLIDRALKGCDHDGGGNQPAEPSGVHAELALGLGDPGVKDPR